MKKIIPQEKTVQTLQSPIKRFENVAIISVFTIIGIAYLITLLTLYPNMPITTQNAENIPAFKEIYPPFRMDEVNYYTMAQNIINGEPYKEDSIEKNFSIGFSIVAVPFIVVWDKLGGYIANMVIVWFSLLTFFLIARRYVSKLKALLMTLLLGCRSCGRLRLLRFWKRIW